MKKNLLSYAVGLLPFMIVSAVYLWSLTFDYGGSLLAYKYMIAMGSLYIIVPAALLLPFIRRWYLKRYK